MPHDTICGNDVLTGGNFEMTTPSLLDYIKEHMLVGDGAMSTWLYNNGIPIGICCEELVLSRPSLIMEVHHQYYEAGARLIETNTFGANRDALARYGLQAQVHRLNREAAVLARQGVGDDAYIMGSMTSVTGARQWDKAMVGYDRIFLEQAEALLAGSVDGLILETFLDLEELLLALKVVRPLTDKPIIAQLACIEIGLTRDGYSLSDALTQLQQAGANVVGLNCRLGPFEMLRSLEQSPIDPVLPLSVFPNAGRLASGEEATYTASPEYFAEQAAGLHQQGACIIGGCCGTTPAHIAAISRVISGKTPVKRPHLASTTIAIKANDISSSPPLSATSIVDQVKKRHTIIVELDPPRDLDVEKYLTGADNLHRAGADAITMAENSMAQARMSPLALGAMVKNRLGIDPLVHITCRDRNLLGQQSHLMGLNALGIHQILVVTGDPPRYGDIPDASAVYDVSSFDLIRMVQQFNQGMAFSGKPMVNRLRFVVGAAFNPHVNNYQHAIARLNKKVEAGADFIMTQPIYDIETLELIYHSTKDMGIPIFIGVMPLISSRNAEFLHNEVPGIKLSDTARTRMKKYSGERAREEGLIMAQELLQETVSLFRGIYLVTPFASHHLTAELTRYVKDITR
ncbi:MAG: bifunctional homocysteine S-methyltransferase/methylenetetrahydrofolate reductase [Methylocystaceae bacterium]